MVTPAQFESKPPFARRWLLRSAALVLGLVVLWLAAANIWLATWGSSVISRRPDKLQVSYDRAWTLWPGRINTRNLRLSAQTARNQWQLSVDHANLHIDLFRLFHREFVLHAGQSVGADFRLRRLARPDEDLKLAAQGLPEIEAFTFTAMRERTPPVPGKQPWRIQLDNLTIDGLREVWFDQTRVLASPSDGLVNPEGLETSSNLGSVSGALDVVMRGDLSLDAVVVHWSDAELLYQDQSVARSLALRTQLSLAPTSSRKLRDPETFRGLTGEVQANASVKSLGFLRTLLPPEQRFAVAGNGQLDLLAKLDRGELDEGTKLTFEAESLTADVASFTGTGSGTIVGSVERRETERWLELALALAEVDIEAANAERKVATADRVQLVLEGRRPRLGAPMHDLRVLLELPDLEVPDLTLFADLIPRGLGLQLIGGSGVAETRVELRDDSQRADFEFEATDAELLFRGTRILGTLTLSGKTASQRSKGQLTLTDTKLAFNGKSRPTGMRASRARPVSFELELGDTELRLPASGSVVGGGLRLATGVLEVTGRAADLRWWETPIQGADWLKLSGEAEIEASLRLVGSGRSTRIGPPSTMSVNVPAFTAELGRWVATANGSLAGDLQRKAGSNRSELEIRLRSPSVVREDASPLEVPAIVVRASGPDLSRGLDLDATRLVLTADRTSINDFSIFNDYFPTEHFLLEGGSGSLEGELEFRGRRADGRLSMESARIDAQIAGERVHAKVELSTLLASNEAASGRFTPTGTTLRLTDVAFPNIPEQSGDWWAVVDLEEGELKVGQPLALDTQVKLRLRDTEPLVHLVGKSRNVVRWFSRLLEVQDITGVGRLILDESGVRFNDLDIQGQGLKIQGRVDLRGPTAALLLIELRGLDAGIEINGDWRDVKVLRPRKWFAERSAVWNGG